MQLPFGVYKIQLFQRRGLMKKKQAEEYFQQLKKMDKAKNIQLPELINIITGGQITLTQFKLFTAYVASNQFGQYNHVEEYITGNDWRKLQFANIYAILKALKDFMVKNKIMKNSKDVKQSLEVSRRDLTSCSNSPKGNSTVVDILQNLKLSEDPEKKAKDEQFQFEEKWKRSKIKLIKKLLVIFDYFRKSRHVDSESFQKNRQIAEYFDLILFMRYFKQFELGSVFDSHKAIKCFKSNAINTLWLDFDKFVNTHFQLCGFEANLTNKQKYLRLRGISELISSQKLKKMLNVRTKSVVTDLLHIHGHTGTYKQDILNFLLQKQHQRQVKIEKKWSHKVIKTQNSQQFHSNSLNKQYSQRPSQSSKKLKSISVNSRIKTEQSPSVYDQLKLPKLRLKEYRQESVYKSLKQLDLSQQYQKIKQLVNINQNEQFLNQYLKQETKQKQKKKQKAKKLVQLPTMKFS